MAKKHPPYAPEFCRQMIELVRSGRTPEELAKEFEPSAQAIRNWVGQADRDEGRRGDGVARTATTDARRNRCLVICDLPFPTKTGRWPPITRTICSRHHGE